MTWTRLYFPALYFGTSTWPIEPQELASPENVGKVVLDEAVIDRKSKPYLIYQNQPAQKVASAE